MSRTEARSRLERMTAPCRPTTHPARLLLDVTPRCNMRCAMCPRAFPEGPWKGEDAGEAAVPRFLDLLRKAAPAHPLVQVALYGEPLLIPGFTRFVRSIKELGICVAINTNGLLADLAMCRALATIPLDAVFFSLDAVDAATYQAIRGVDKLAFVRDAVMNLLRQRGSAPLPRIGVSFTRQDANVAEQDRFVETWASHVDAIRVSALVTPGGLSAHTLRPIPAERIPCRMLYETMPVFQNGDVGICCQDHRCAHKMGNVFETSVEEVWNGPAFQEARRLHEEGAWDRLPLCASCDRWAQFDYEEERRAGLVIRTSPHMRYYNRTDRLAGWEGALRGGHDSIQA